ncbi:MAG: type 4a pilus biogenesis protein PilO [Acidobacteria bacterium]|nr:type 4a pilus biogenesis protein PilO [Acidobacteriota bacterium]
MALEESHAADNSFRSRLLVMVLLLALAGALYLYGVAPRRAQLALLLQQIEMLRAELHKGQAVEASLPQFKREISRQREHLRTLRQILPEGKETADIIRQIQRLAAESNLRIRSFTPQQTVRRDFYEDWPILIAVEGSYGSLGIFLDKVGSFSRIINVDNISIRGLDKPAGQRTLSATCTATTFVFLENQEES